MKKLPRCSMREAGIDASGVRRFADRAEKLGIHAFMVLRRGKVACEAWWKPFSPDHPHMLHSLSKIFTSTAVGFAVQEGLLRLDDKVVQFFPELLPCQPCEHMQTMTLRHLLTMNTGHTEEPVEVLRKITPGFAQEFLRSYVPLTPGTHFLYNTDATYMVSAILQAVTGQTVAEYLRPRLFEPLGFGEYWWDQSLDGVSLGGFGLNATTEDIAKFGQFLLQKGSWEGKQLLDPGWIEAATGYQVSTAHNEEPDWICGYGFQFWQCSRPGMYRGDGAWGQYCVVDTRNDLVLAVNAMTEDMQGLLTAFYEEIVDRLSDDLPDQKEGEDRFNREKECFCALRPLGTPEDPMQKTVSGHRYRMSANDWGIRSVSFTFGEDACLRMENEDGCFTLPISFGTYEEAFTASAARNPILSKCYREAACAGAWKEGKFYLRLLYTRCTVYDDWEVRFLPHGIRLSVARSGCFLAKSAEIMGILEE